MRTLDAICAFLLLVGGLNWGLVGAFDFNLVAAIFGGPEFWLTDLVYVLVGLAAIYECFAIWTIRDRLTTPTVTATTTRYDRAA